MERRDKIIYSIGGVLILTGIGVGVWLLARPVSVEKLASKNGGGSSGGNKSNSTASSSSSTDSNTPTDSVDTPEQVQYDTIHYGDHLDAGSFPLQLASKNKLVWDIQNALNNQYGTDLVTDGNMGEETTKAICSKVFTWCISENPVHRKIKIQKDLYDDILAGKKRNDLTLPTK